MPQMSPMNWLTLMIMFTVILITCISLIYFIYHQFTLIYTPLNFNKTPNNLKKFKNLNWKW
uniref:ATP synthase F0 subunit 8 n=1 Tax=Trachelus iudaicus TaxID=1090881 RepID=A0A1J0KHK6_9HYME|nr:ATP synthase F0 subunit 8 [Trachelus iudaicus]APC92664.1 ATP synthase F0 subunit 8 [Trachelus iudaicus]